MSRVTMIFNSSKPLEFQIERAKRIEEFGLRNLDNDLYGQLVYYFAVNNSDVLQQCKDLNIPQLLSILPIHLKAETFYYLY